MDPICLSKRDGTEDAKSPSGVCGKRGSSQPSLK
jgi:hypothetical protein